MSLNSTFKLLAGIGLFACIVLQGNPTIAAQETSDEIPITEYPTRYLYNTLVEPNFVVHWGSPFAARVEVKDPMEFFQSDGMEAVYGAMTDQAKQPGWSKWSFGRGEFVVEFFFIAKQNKSAVKVDGIRIYVDAYRPLPETSPYGVVPPVGGAPGRLFYTVISPPPEGHRSYFTARYLPERGNEQEAKLFLEPGRPELVTVKIDASKPGYYMVGGDVLLSQGTELQRYNLGSWNHVIYFK